MIFSRSLQDGIFPTLWKKSFVNPVHKQGDRTSVLNYRPICLLSPIASLLEHIINTKLISYISPLISPKQHGFIPGKSVSTNLLQLSEEVTHSIENGHQVDTVYLDLSKAFDTIDHGKLLHKLHNLGIDLSLIKWFSSYLHAREQIVQVQGYESNSYIVTSGVAQGSRLGPLLFALFVNDLVDEVRFSNIELFADNCRISKTVRCTQDALDFQDDINRVVHWIMINGLTINTHKCQKITFARKNNLLSSTYFINGTRINEVDSIRDLGVILDKNWTFDNHIQNVLSKSSKCLGFIKRLSYNFISLDTLTYLFKALVLPTLTYTSIIWARFTQNRFEELNSIVKKFLRFASYKNGNPMGLRDHDYSDISRLCQVYRVESIHEYRDICFVADYSTGNIRSTALDRNFTERNLTYNLRFPRKYQEYAHRNNYVFNAPIYRIIRSWNTISEDVRRHLLDYRSKNLLKETVLKCF